MVRYPRNPILTRSDIPNIPPHLSNVTSVFNPGAIKHNDTYLLMLRVQSRSRETYFVMAKSRNGIDFVVEKEVVQFTGIEEIRDKIYHVYDARITKLEGNYYIMFAMDMEGTCRLGLAKTNDFQSFDFLGIVSNEDSRNGVIFPEKIRGKYLRMDRPNEIQRKGEPRSGSTVWLSESDNLLKWKYVAPIMSGRTHYWDELIGSGPPPVKTKEGWLHIYHGVATHFGSSNIYQAGVILLDLDDPTKVIGRCRNNILEPREAYEFIGQVPNVVFPSGWIVEEIDERGFALPESEVKIYYGAADTVVGLATTTVRELNEAAREKDNSTSM